MVKKILMFFVVFLLGVQVTEVSSQAYGNKKDISEYSVNEIVPQDIYDYITTDIRDDILNLLKDSADNFGILKEDVEGLTWEKAYVIYDIDEEIQKKEYFFPIVNEGQEVIANIAVLDTEYGIQFSISKDMVFDLNKIGDWQRSIFFRQGDTILAQNSSGICNITEGKITDKFIGKPLVEKKKEIVEELKNAKQVEVEQLAPIISKKELRSYTPSFSNDLGYYYLKLYNAQGQGDYRLCWAASAATIINYRLGQSVTAKNIADKLGRGYNDGGDISDINNVLRMYNVYYYAVSSMMSFDDVMKNIKAKYPIAMRCKAANPGNCDHIITIYGFRNLTSGSYLMCWDSDMTPSEEGNLRIITYNNKGSMFLADNAEYTWNGSAFGIR